MPNEAQMFIFEYSYDQTFALTEAQAIKLLAVFNEAKRVDRPRYTSGAKIYDAPYHLSLKPGRRSLQTETVVLAPVPAPVPEPEEADAEA